AGSTEPPHNAHAPTRQQRPVSSLGRASAVIDRPRIVLGPQAPQVLADAVRRAGGTVAQPGESADGLVWSGFDGFDAAGAALQAEGIFWVQLPGAGIERYLEHGYVADHRTWTCA